MSDVWTTIVASWHVRDAPVTIDWTLPSAVAPGTTSQLVACADAACTESQVVVGDVVMDGEALLRTSFRTSGMLYGPLSAQLMVSLDNVVSYNCAATVDTTPMNLSRQLRGPTPASVAAGGLEVVALVCGITVIAVLGIFSNIFRKRAPSNASITQPTRSPNVSSPTLFCHGLDEAALLPQEATSSSSVSELWKTMYHGHVVMLKTIRSHHSQPTQEDIETFTREIAFLTKLTSPYVVNVLGGRYLATGSIQIVMEHMPHGDLKTHLGTTPAGGSAWEAYTELALDIAQGLCLLHSYGLPHGDLKSRNVLLGPIAAASGRVGCKLTDFGLTRTLELDSRQMAQAIGLYRWTAPEVVQQIALTPASDIYSFGMLLFEMDCREVPYWSRRSRQGQMLTDMAVAIDVVQHGMRPNFKSTCPVWVEELCLRCVDPNPAKRPTATQLRDAILDAMTSATADDVAPLPTFGPSRFSVRGNFSTMHHSSILDLMGEKLNLHDLRPWRVDESQLQPIEEIAKGAFGEVWRGLYKGNPVAIKTLIAFESHTPEDLQVFIDEMKIMTTLRSRYICQMIGASWMPSCEIKLVLEYMNGGDLKNYLTRTAATAEVSTAWSEKLLIALDIVEGLCYIHDLNIIHRDLKSRNVLLQNAGRLSAKLTDFGISRYIEMDGRSMSCGVGTYRWMAPEIILGKHYTVAVDMYSFGMILNEMDTHQVPYYNERTPEGQLITDIGIGDKVRRGLLRPKFTSSCPPWVQALALRCVDMNPDSRPTARQVRNEIKCQLDPALFESS
ncbi:TKL protein kinase [Saprolegnia parasitica CBS 223.65]|uniref:TKL protein kinase n=1 Tax=Saprolegnia parasitica (strain CBS 223.65) TaxID=695850 RepID=A0A067BXA2_SAPPC|nr:TKL protein kinase [Saprolegnia parasitica CBS 223.65]KDO21485.1 TKL protein kinase [Saprolegnia parasitica CBS 223.65]|eukprot:XP_012207829.1 TKL protein kinase [Saprolegnia parasitica CBS 223.65]